MDFEGDTMMSDVFLEPDVPTHHTHGSGANFILPFGINKGEMLSEVPGDYLRWLDNNIDHPAPILKKSISDVLGASKGREMEIDWIEPLSTAPNDFHEWGKMNRGQPKGNDTALWITTFSISKYFRLTEDILEACHVRPLPDNQSSQTSLKSSPTKYTRTARYALYHIWDLSKRYMEVEDADAALENYINEVLRGIGKGSSPKKEKVFGRY